MSDFRVGRIARALRQRLGWRQVDVARRAAVSQARVSTLERGWVENLSIGMLRRILRALDADLVVSVRWRGGELDRLLDELAWHEPSSTLLVAEIKTEITSVEETLRRHDVKCRLAAGLAAARIGWRALTVARLLVLPDTMTARRRVERHEAVFSRAYPLRSDPLRRWLRNPVSGAAGLLFAPGSRDATGVGNAVARKRVGVPRSRTRRWPTGQIHASHRKEQSPSD